MPSVAPLRILLPCLASVALALLANGLLTGELLTRSRDIDPLFWGGAQTAGALVLLLAVAVAAWAFGRRDDFAPAGGPASASSGVPGPRAGDRGALPRWIAFLPAAALWLAASILFLLIGENATVRWLWLGSIIAFALPLLREALDEYLS